MSNGVETPPGVAFTPSPFGGGGYLYRPGELLAAPDSVDLVEEQINAIGGSLHERQDFVPLGVSRLLTDVDVPSFVAHAHTVAHETVPQVAPNHVLHPLSHWRFYGKHAPKPADPLPEQEEDRAGGGAKVVVIDSGAWDHPWFRGRVQIAPGDVEGPDEDGNGALDLVAGHGTFICGLILQHAPGAEVHAMRVPDLLDEGPGRSGVVDDLQLAAMLDALDDDVDVVNLSLGGWTHNDMAPPLTALALQRLRARIPGIAIVAAAGNEPLTRPTWPAAFKGVLAVGALAASDTVWNESARGWWVDAWAPGVEAHSTFLHWYGPMDHPDGAPSRFEGWAQWTGTSFAAPRIVGGIARDVNSRGGVSARKAAFEMLAGAPSLPGIDGVILHPPTAT